jgi:hypothetical protein
MLSIYEAQGLKLSLAWKECTVSNFGVSDKKKKTVDVKETIW